MNENIKERWTQKAKDNLVGCKIIKVQYMDKDELDAAMWYSSPICMLLQNPKGKKFWIYPSMDDEGNNGGALFTTLPDYPYAPVI